MNNKRETFLRMEKICKSFPGVKALSNARLEVKKGEIKALVGGNGAGKSTLIKILSGVYSKDSGDIYINGEPTEIDSPRAAEALGISTIYQELALIPYLTVAENIYLGRQPKNAFGLVDWKKMNSDAAALLERLNIHIDESVRVRTLSPARRQLVEIARAMSVDAKLVIMDEPTSSLATREIEILFAIIRRLKAQGVAVVFISHRLEEIFAVCERVAVIRDGRFVGDYASTEITKERLISLMTGRSLERQYPRRDVKLGEEVLRVENLSGLDKIKNVRFSVRKGEVLGFAGLAGAGRTEVMRLLFGADKKDGGVVRLRGKEVRIRRPRDAIRNGIGFVTEDRKNEGLILPLAMRMNVSIVAKDKIMKRGLLNMKEERRVARRYVDELGIRTPSVDQLVVNLSGGNQQKVVLSKWLLSDCDVMILDEPTRGIDVGAKRDIYEIINALAASGRAILMVSSETEELTGVCDRVAVMSEGRITGELDRADFSREKITEYAVGGTRE